MSRFYENFNEHFCSFITSMWLESRIVTVKYGLIKQLVVEKKYFPIEAIQDYLNTLYKAVNDRSILRYTERLVEMYPDHEMYRNKLEHLKGYLDNGTFFFLFSATAAGHG